MIATISSKPKALTAHPSAQFTFSTESDVEPASGYECKLHSSDARDTSALHGWQKCESPAKFGALTDGAYTFSVRVQGEQLADSWRFEVDVSPPVTTILPVRRLRSPSSSAVTLARPRRHL